MARYTAFAIGVLLSSFVGSVTASIAEDYRPGDHVVVIAAGTRIGSDGHVVDKVWLGLVLQVESVERDRLWVSHGKPGWLEQSKVVLADRKAIDRLTEMIKADPRNARLYYGRASVWTELDENDQALADCNQAIKLDPNDSQAYCRRAAAWSDKKNNDRVLADLSDALRLNPKFAEACVHRGVHFYESDDFERSIADCTEAIRIDPKWERAYVCRAVARLYGRQDADGAIADCEEALRLDSRDSAAYDACSFAWLGKQPERAIEILDEEIRVIPSARAYSTRALMRIPLEQFDLAIADCTEALRLDPKLACAWDNRGSAYVLKKQYDRALADLTEAIRIDSKQASTYSNRGCAWLGKGDYDHALADFNEAVRINPEDANAHANRGRAWMCKGDYDRAIAEYTEAIRIEPDRAKAHRDRAVTRMLQRRREAIEGFQAVIDQDDSRRMSVEGVIFGNLTARLLKDEKAADRFLASSAASVDDDWPSPLLRFLRHEIDDRWLLSLATDAEKQIKSHYCIAMIELIENQPDRAKTHFRWIQEHADGDPIYRDVAVLELKRLEERRSKP
jgi:tetratricopeptide (TPR) repeat protein